MGPELVVGAVMSHAILFGGVGIVVGLVVPNWRALLWAVFVLATGVAITIAIVAPPDIRTHALLMNFFFVNVVSGAVSALILLARKALRAANKRTACLAGERDP